jgi:hypothetical protein
MNNKFKGVNLQRYASRNKRHNSKEIQSILLKSRRIYKGKTLTLEERQKE